MSGLNLNMSKKLLFILFLLGTLLALYFFHSANHIRLENEAIVLPHSLPEVHPPAEMKAYQIPTGITFRSAAFAYESGSFSDKRNFVMTALLVKHPKGDILIDCGFGENIETHMKKLPWEFRLITSFQKGSPARTQLLKARYDIKKLRSILLTHAHWDHISGAEDFLNTPIELTHPEREFINSKDPSAAVAKYLSHLNYQEYEFKNIPYLGFSQSRDYYGDGSVVIVPASGHTPGSVIIFLNFPSGKRYAMLGDLVWQTEGVFLNEQKPLWIRTFFDKNTTQVKKVLTAVSNIAKKFPQIKMVPSHDARGFIDFETINNQ